MRKTDVSIKTIKLSTEGVCADAKHCFNPAWTFPIKTKWIEENDLYIDKSDKVYSLVVSKDQAYLMDAITGRLYQFGQCATSQTLSISGIARRNKSKAEQILMGKNKPAGEADE